jgi:hypothetical protein
MKSLINFCIEKGESVLPIAFQSRLNDIFSQIEKEFEALYLENITREWSSYFELFFGYGRGIT